MCVRLHVRVDDRHRPQPRIRHELDLGHDRDAEALEDRLAHGLAAADLHRHPRHDARGAQRLVEGLARRRSRLAHDHRLLRELGDADAAPPGEAMVVAHEHDYPLRAERHEMQARIGRVLREHGDVGSPIEPSVDDLLGVAYRNREPDRRVAALECGEDRPHVIRADRTHVEPPAAQLAGVLEQRERLTLLLEDALRDRGESLAGAGERDAAAAPQEELDAEARLEGAHLRGHRRLADVQRPRAGGEPAVARDRVERAQVCQSHRPLLYHAGNICIGSMLRAPSILCASPVAGGRDAMAFPQSGRRHVR